MRIKLPLLFFFVYSFTYSQIDFEDHLIANSENSTLGASSVYAADLDGDGDMDMLSASYWDDKVAWYENLDGLGNFGPQQIISTQADRPGSVKTGDLDGDGDLDLLSASTFDNKIAWYENDGSGNFGPQQVISTNALIAMIVHTADFDGDGDLDVLSASSGDNKIAWYENTNGLGDFGSEQIISTNAQEARAIHTADLDGDGDLDVLSASQGDDKIAWYVNTDGLGTFGPQEIIDASVDRAYAIFASDLDGDGDMDVLSASYQDGKIAWYENVDGAANFSPKAIISTSALMATSLYASDLDGDNDMDILSASAYDGGKITWYENMDAQGTFGAEQIITVNVDFPKYIYTADLNGDGKQDVLSASEIDDKIAWHENLGQGNFGPQKRLNNSVLNAHAIFAADLDGDGDKDALSASRDDGKVAWYENDGQGNFGEQKMINPYMSEATSVFASDLDGDGDMDVLSTSWSSDKVFWDENLDGSGNSWEAHEITDYTGNIFADRVFWVSAADLDGDNDMDVLSASVGDNKIAWYENLGQGNFDDQTVISDSGNSPQELHATDMDGDGDLDLLAVGQFITWFENTDGAGNFVLGQNIVPPGTTEFYSVYPVDLDNDGDKDVLTAYIGDCAWFENTDGSGNFGSMQLIGEDGNSTAMVHAADIDDDGDKDVLMGGLYENIIRWYENDGSGNFGQEQHITINSGGTRSLYSADLDMDDDIDILSAAWEGNPAIFEGGNKIMWYENLSELSIHEYSKNLFSLYPNPTTGILQIHSEIPIKKIEVINSLGQSIYTSNQEKIDLSKLASGIYFVKITAENGDTSVQKIVKE